MVDAMMRLGFMDLGKELKRQAPNDPTPTMNSPGEGIDFGKEPAEHEMVERLLISGHVDHLCILCNLEWHSRYRDVR